VQFIISEHTIIYFNHQRDLFRPARLMISWPEKLNWNKRASLFTLLVVRDGRKMWMCVRAFNLSPNSVQCER
jgi:hypothetical protein